MKKALCILLIFILAAPPRSAIAWSEAGHHIIAVMAFNLLTKAEQARILSLLEKHPRYAEDFSPPENLPNDEEISHWRIGRASYWPDVIRKTSLDRPTWHYELGPTLVIGNRAYLKIPERPGELPKAATLETQALHISQAIALCEKTLADNRKSDADRAIAFCWIAHLVADAHQPCHAGSLYMEKVFVEEDGDRGANRIVTKQAGNMHALWDQLLGNEFTLDGTRQRIVEITTNHAFVAKGKTAIAEANSLDPHTWLAESRAYAVEHVYAPEVLKSLQLVARGVIDQPESIDIPEEYLKNAGSVAQVRSIEAAYRLAETYRKALK